MIFVVIQVKGKERSQTLRVIDSGIDFFQAIVKEKDASKHGVL